MVKVLMFFLCIFASIPFAHSEGGDWGVDRAEPVSIAKHVFESALMYDFDALRNLSSSRLLSDVDEGENKARATVEFFRQNGINFKDDIRYDFSNTTYRIVSEKSGIAKVELLGSYDILLQGEIYKKSKVHIFIHLVRQGGKYYFNGWKNKI